MAIRNRDIGNDVGIRGDEPTDLPTPGTLANETIEILPLPGPVTTGTNAPVTTGPLERIPISRNREGIPKFDWL